MTAPLRVAIAGLGTVGGHVCALLEKNRTLLEQRAERPVQLVGICARNKKKARPFTRTTIPWFSDPCAMIDETNCDVAVELIGGEDGIARTFVEHALNKKCSVVTANKALLAKHGKHLFPLAEKQGCALAFEAAVGGGIPIIKSLRESLSGNHIYRITAILNGTCNYILSQMRAQRRSFQDVLEEAQRLGYAEADPSVDIDGFDAAHKLALLAALAWGTLDIDSLTIDGIRTITAEDMALSEKMGYRLKHIAQAYPAKTTIHQSVQTCLVRQDHALAHVDGVFNAVTFLSDFCGELTLIGLGAGGDATASAVVSDILDLARGSHEHPSRVVLTATPTFPQARIPTTETMPYYVRLHVDDRPGVLAEIATTLAHEHISIETAWQQATEQNDVATLVIITHPSPSPSMHKAFAAVGTLKPVRQAPCLLPIINA
ncbi:MAG: homoserine dehydrogenase [Alphaproteobacteria bacterium GM202ARS2]|nr:homoserine dehydrogenase [Alphaproteobacteria bacterium GM202ARS2]